MKMEEIEHMAEQHSILDLGRISPEYECGFYQGANYAKELMAPTIDRITIDVNSIEQNSEKIGRNDMLVKVFEYFMKNATADDCDKKIITVKVNLEEFIKEMKEGV